MIGTQNRWDMMEGIGSQRNLMKPWMHVGSFWHVDFELKSLGHRDAWERHGWEEKPWLTKAWRLSPGGSASKVDPSSQNGGIGCDFSWPWAMENHSKPHNEDLPMIYHLDRFGGRISPFLASLVTNHKLSWKLQQTAVDPDETWLNSWSLTSDLLCLAKHDRAVTGNYMIWVCQLFFLLVPNGSKMMPKRITGWKGSSQEMMSIGWGPSGMFRSWWLLSVGTNMNETSVWFLFSFFLGSECAITARYHYLKWASKWANATWASKNMFLDVFGEFVLFCLVRCSVSYLLHSHNLDISWYNMIYEYIWYIYHHQILIINNQIMIHLSSSFIIYHHVFIIFQ